jgi:hypothetical protein
MMKTLLRAGANVDAKDECGRTCLYHAVRSRLSFAIIDLLLQFGANVNAHCNMQYGGRSPMDVANRQQTVHILDIVRERRLRIFNQMDEIGIPREIQEKYLMPSL